jgi:hypothetical protein
MGEWAKVVTEPLGLVGFALFLVFTYLGQVSNRDRRKWLRPVAFACAAITLIGGFGLAYLQMTKPVPAPASTVAPAGPAVVPPVQQVNHVQQTSTGAGSPNVQGVNGDVTITVDQSTGKSASPKPAPKQQP